MTQHLALAADATVHSARTLRACVQLARRMKTERITLLQAVPKIVRPDARLERVNAECAELHARMHAGVEKQLQHLGELVKEEASVEVGAQVVDGLPAKALPKAAVDVGATTLVVGSHGHHHSWLQKMFESHVAPAIIHASKLPTLVFNAADGDSPADHALGEMSRILVAADREPGALDALQVALDWARRSGRNPRVTVLVKEPVKDELLSAIRALYANIEVVGFRPRGKRGDKILWLAEQMGAHLTVLATDGANRRKYFGAVAGVLSRQPKMPMLIARARGVPLESLIVEDVSPRFGRQAAAAGG